MKIYDSPRRGALETGEAGVYAARASEVKSSVGPLARSAMAVREAASADDVHHRVAVSRGQKASGSKVRPSVAKTRAGGEQHVPPIPRRVVEVGEAEDDRGDRERCIGTAPFDRALEHVEDEPAKEHLFG